MDRGVPPAAPPACARNTADTARSRQRARAPARLLAAACSALLVAQPSTHAALPRSPPCSFSHCGNLECRVHPTLPMPPHQRAHPALPPRSFSHCGNLECRVHPTLPMPPHQRAHPAPLTLQLLALRQPGVPGAAGAGGGLHRQRAVDVQVGGALGRRGVHALTLVQWTCRWVSWRDGGGARPAFQPALLTLARLPPACLPALPPA